MRGIRFLILLLMITPRICVGEFEAVSPAVYEKLSQVHKLMDQQRYELALKRLQSIRPSRKRGSDQAMVLQTAGYLYAAMERYPKAIDSLQRCLALKNLPKSARKNTLYTLAQLQVESDDVKASMQSLDAWFKLEQSPSAQAHAFAGWVYAQAQEYDRAIRHLRHAISKTGQMNEAWYRQLLSINYDISDYRAAVDLLKEMTRLFPQREAYWRQLSATYRRLHDDARSLAVLELAHRQDLLNDETGLIELANYYRYLDTPHKAGKLMEEAMRDGKITPTAEHWRLLSDSWLQAKELRKAMSVLQTAADQAQRADWYMRLAALASRLDENLVVIQAVDAALQVGALDRPGKGFMLKAMAHYKRAEYEAARRAFEQSMSDPSTETEAKQWLDYLAREWGEDRDITR